MTKRLRVLALMHDDLVPPETRDRAKEQDLPDWRTEFDVVEALQVLGHEVVKLGVGDDVAAIRDAVQTLQPHVAFNLLVEFHGAGTYDQHVASYLELLRTNYTGCNPRGLTLARDKALSKEVLAYHRVRAPRFQTFARGRPVRKLARLRFPLFVKCVNEEASLGISGASLVRDDAALVERVEWLHAQTGCDAIAEEYVEGRELYVGVLGNTRLCTFPARELLIDHLPKGAPTIATRRVKWDKAYQRKMGVRTAFAELPEALARELARVARRAYKCLRMSGYGRLDFRLDPEGRLFLLEANPNADLSRDDDFAEAAEGAGIGYERLIQRLLALGMGYRADWKEPGRIAPALLR
jgi:D-alanine-D-alanine ligase